MQNHTKKGSLLGGILLVSGCCIGAGMLGLPVLSSITGFKPSIVMMIFAWLYMLSTALLLLEVNLWFKDDVSLVSMAGRTLGNVGKAVAWFVFLYLFYSLMVGYIAASSELFTDFIEEFTQISFPDWVGGLAMIAIFGIALYLGTVAVDQFNRLLMLGLVLSYVLLVIIGMPHVDTSFLQHTNWKASVFVLPVLIISFGYHNLIPSLTTYLQRDVKRLKLILIIGSLIPLLIYVVWEWLILGLIPLEGKGGFIEALDNGEMATRALKMATGVSWVVEVAQYFAFFAIVTSFLGVALSFIDFLADGLSIKKNAIGQFYLCCLVLIPPFIFALVHPKIFLAALNFAGGFGAVVVFGILPALMAWSGRYYKKLGDLRLVPGGKGVLILIILCSCAIFGIQLVQQIKG
jgi:tyrosine-specific transport protein